MGNRRLIIHCRLMFAESVAGLLEKLERSDRGITIRGDAGKQSGIEPGAAAVCRRGSAGAPS